MKFELPWNESWCHGSYSISALSRALGFIFAQGKCLGCASMGYRPSRNPITDLKEGSMPVSHMKPENGMVKWSWSFSRGALTTSHFRVCYQAQIRDVNAEGATKTGTIVVSYLAVVVNRRSSLVLVLVCSLLNHCERFHFSVPPSSLHSFPSIFIHS